MEENSTTSAPSQSLGKVLIIEDDKFFMDLLAKRLSSANFTTFHAPNGEAGISLAQKETPNVILLDILLPEMDGLEVCAKLKADEKLKDIPVIFLSNLGSKEQLQKGKELGAFNFLIKATVSLDQIIKETELAVKDPKAKRF